MSHLQYYVYKGRGETSREQFWYSQAVRVGDRIECAGQGGWEPNSGVIHKDFDAEIDQAFSNVDLAIRTAGGKGWSQVFRINSYHLSLDDAAHKAMYRNFRKWLPDHQPIWTCIQVPALGDPDMHVEIEVCAHDPEGAKTAASNSA